MNTPLQKNFSYTPFITFSNRLVVAPMAGITDTPFRKISRLLGAGCCYSEMISADALVRQNKATLNMVTSASDEPSLIVQIFGSEPDILSDAATICEDLKITMLDINMGCPVKKVFNKGAGAALLSDINKLKKILQKVRKAVSIPLSIKIRSGINGKSINAVEVAKAAEDAGANLIAVHPRTRDQFFLHKSDWKIIEDVKKSVKLPIIGNGDIFSTKDALKMITDTGCDLIMIGRALKGNPWLIKEILTGTPLGWGKRWNIIENHIDLMINTYGETGGIKILRKHLLWYLKGFYGACSIRKKITSITTLAEVNSILEGLKKTNGLP